MKSIMIRGLVPLMLALLSILPATAAPAIGAPAIGASTMQRRADSDAAQVEVRNNSTRAVMIEVDGRRMAEVPAGGVVQIDGIRSGNRWLTAVSDGVPMAREAVNLPARSTYIWRLGSTDSADAGIPVLRVSNFAGQPIRIYARGLHRIDINPGETAAMVGVGIGQIELEARAANGRVVARNSVSLAPGEEKLWQVVGAGGGRAFVEVVNFTRIPVKVCVDGNLCLRLASGSRSQYDALAPGRHTFEAFEVSTDRPLEIVEGDLSVGNNYQWVVGGEQ